MRAILRGETPPKGEFFNTAFQFMGYASRPDMPNATSPGSRSTSPARRGDRGRRDALAVNPDYIRDVVVPAVSEGRERAARQWRDSRSWPRAGGLYRRANEPGPLSGAALVPYASLPCTPHDGSSAPGSARSLAAFDDGVQVGDMGVRRRGSGQLLNALVGIGSAMTCGRRFSAIGQPARPYRASAGAGDRLRRRARGGRGARPSPCRCSYHGRGASPAAIRRPACASNRRGAA